MSGAQAIAKRQLDQVLEDSISERRRATLTHDTPSGWRMFKSQFVSGSATSRVICLRSPITTGAASWQFLAPGETLGVTFRLGHKKCMFAAALESVHQEANGVVVTLHWPDQLQQLQRRAYERAKPPKDAVIAVRFWHEDRAMGIPAEGRNVHNGQLEDLSAGGLRVRVAGATDVQVGVSHRCVFTPHPGRPPLVLDTVVRHREAAEHGRASIGFQIVGLETTAEGRHMLDRLARTVSQFQRAQSRRRG